jgi:hypothetical protein
VTESCIEERSRCEASELKLCLGIFPQVDKEGLETSEALQCTIPSTSNSMVGRCLGDRLSRCAAWWPSQIQQFLLMSRYV